MRKPQINVAHHEGVFKVAKLARSYRLLARFIVTENMQTSRGDSRFATTAPSTATANHWQHHRAMPNSFYDGTTGIAPVDDTIRRILDTGYGHHIERLMVLGGFMFLCEIDPDDIYRWFMEMFVDSYDWVMVPNVYAMSQNADGGMITTKPYFSGS